MFERIYNLKNKKKGFTLVELIVVLVILAILLAILVPSMTQWIKKAKEKQILVNARTVYLACQTEASEEYAKPGFTALTITATKVTYTAATEKDPAKITTDTNTEATNSIAALANLTVDYTFTCATDANGNVTSFTYNDGTNTASIAAGSSEFTVTTTPKT